HFLYFLPLPHGHGSLRPTFGSSRRTVLITSSPPVRAACGLWLSPPYEACLAEADEAERPAPAKAGIADSAAALFIVMGVARRATGRGATGASSFITGRSHMT